MSGEINELYRSETTVIGACNNLLLLFAIGSPTERDFDAVMHVAKRVMAPRWPSGMAILLCTKAGARPPNPQLREKMTALFKGLAPCVSAMAFVVLGQGFMPAAVRSILAALNLAVRAEYPTKVFSDLYNGVAWVVSRVDGVDEARFDQRVLLERAKALVTSSVPPTNNASRV